MIVGILDPWRSKGLDTKAADKLRERIRERKEVKVRWVSWQMGMISA